MKKMLLGLFLVLGMASFANSKIELKGAYDLGGKYHFEKSSVKGKANAMEAGAEYRYEVNATAKYTFDTAAPVKPYVKGDLGYSINNNDAKDGVYYGVGAGLNINDNFNVDVMYKENKGKYEIGTKDYKADYRRVSLGVGYNFNLGQ